MRRFVAVYLAMAFSCALFFALAHEVHAVVQSPPMLQITYPQVVKIHPPVVHFAIVLPILTILDRGI